MRRVLLSASFVILLAAVYFSWMYRFERDEGQPVWRLKDMRAAHPPGKGVEWLGRPGQERIRVGVDDETPRVVAELVLPNASEVEGLHFRFRMTSHGLLAGDEDWKDGRVLVGWQPGGGALKEYEPVGSIQRDGEFECESVVIQPNQAPAVPSLRLEHLGRAGQFELSGLEITAIRERGLWKTGRWVLGLAWWIWGTAALRYELGVSRWRALAAALVWLVMAVNFVIPGPWKQQRPIGTRFRIGSERAAGEKETHGVPARAVPKNGAATQQVAETGKPLESMGKLPEQGSFALRVKRQVARARPLLHAMLLFAPAFAFAFLLGWRPAMWLAAALGVGIEFGQIAFGYGFGWDDVFDLTCDAVGIAGALWCWGKLNAIDRKRVVAG